MYLCKNLNKFARREELFGIVAIGAACAFGTSAFASADIVTTSNDCGPPPDMTMYETLVDTCDAPPFCEFPDGMTIYVDEGEEPVIPLWIDGLNECSDSLEVRLYINGDRKDDRDFDDGDGPQCVGLQIGSIRNEPAGTCWTIRADVIDEEADGQPGGGGPTSRCDILVKVRCSDAPICYIDGDLVTRADSAWRTYDVRPGDTLETMEICAQSVCGGRARVEMFARPPFMEPAGHRKGGEGERVCIETKANDVVEAGFAEGTYWAKFKCYDLDNGRYEVLKIGYRYTDPEPETCDDLPECDVLEGSSVTVNIGEASTLTVCGSSPCDDCAVTISGVSLPAFVTEAPDDGRGLAGETCVMYDVAPMDGDEGSHTATFEVTDCNGNTSQCSIAINVPEPMPILACTENEEQNPNDTFANASVIDAGECVDGFGVNLYGVLDTPIVMNGDVDYFRIVNLTPGEVYNATIVAGMSPDNGFTDTMLGWLVAEGVAVAIDDNSGPLDGYSEITFTADADGVATLAITGHGDDDFDGMMDGSMEYEEYGSGGYMLSIRAEAPETMPLEERADLNGDGVIDTGDLGTLLGLFGISSN